MNAQKYDNLSEEEEWSDDGDPTQDAFDMGKIAPFSIEN